MLNQSRSGPLLGWTGTTFGGIDTIDMSSTDSAPAIGVPTGCIFDSRSVKLRSRSVAGQGEPVSEIDDDRSQVGAGLAESAQVNGSGLALVGSALADGLLDG
jgi:hypothetical protein